MVQRSDIIWMLILGLINTGIGCYFYFSSIGYLPVQSVAIVGYVEPLAAILFSVIILGEVLTFLQSLGAVLIIGGALFGEVRRKNRGNADYEVLSRI